MRLLNSPPPLGDLDQGLVSRPPAAHEPAPDRGRGPADSAPAVQVDGLAAVQSGVDGVENAGHLSRAGRDRDVDDRMPLMHDVCAEAGGFHRRDLGIRAPAPRPAR